MMKLLKRDILSYMSNNKITVIGHGCNTYHTMGAGIAAYLRRKYPYVYVVDCKTKIGPDKLGTFSKANINDNLIVLNCYTQDTCGSGRQVDYEAVYKCLEQVKIYTDTLREQSGKPIDIRFPKIGCGLAGGEWSIIRPMFEKLLPYANIYYM